MGLELVSTACEQEPPTGEGARSGTSTARRRGTSNGERNHVACPGSKESNRQEAYGGERRTRWQGSKGWVSGEGLGGVEKKTKTGRRERSHKKERVI